MKQVRVLVVDDSALMRKLIPQMLADRHVHPLEPIAFRLTVGRAV